MSEKINFPLTLTLDSNIQHLIRTELINAEKSFHNIGSAAILMDVENALQSEYLLFLYNSFNFTSTEQIQSPTIILAGDDSLTVNDTSSSKDGTSWEVIYNVTSSEPERDVSFNILYQDIAGNIGDNRTQANSSTNSIRIDTVIPKLDLVSLASNNPDNSTAMAGDNVTLTVQSREALQMLDLVHEDDTLESLTPIGGDGKQWVYSREIQLGETGPVNFRLRFTDLVGNDGIEVSQTTDGSSVSIDTAIPELISYALSVNESPSYTAKPGDTLKVEFTTSEAITSPTIKLAGHEVTASGSGTSWSAEQVLRSSDTAGIIEVELTLTDLTGNSRTLRYPKTSDLLASYSFDGSSNDNSGNGNDLTPHGGVGLSNDRFGRARSAYKFDGNDDYLSGGDVNDLGMQSVTFSAWFKTVMDVINSDGHKILNKGCCNSTHAS